MRSASSTQPKHSTHCTNHCNMWPLGTSAAEEVAEKAALISIDVPADYKWVLLALVGTNQRSTRASHASIAGTRASLASLTTHAQASSSPTSTSSLE